MHSSYRGKNIVKEKEARNRHKAKRKNVIHACGGENSFYCRWDEIEMPENLVLDVVYNHKIAEWHQFYCLHVTPLFPRQWDKLWKLQQGSLWNIKSMACICWNPWKPQTVKPNFRLQTQQEPCGKPVHSTLKFGLLTTLATSVWRVFSWNPRSRFQLNENPVISTPT